MTRIAIFGKQGCAKCATTKNKLNHYLSRWSLNKSVEMVFHDLDTIEGRAEGAFYDVNQIPVTIVEKEGRSVARWDGAVPNSEKLRTALQDGTHASSH